MDSSGVPSLDESFGSLLEERKLNQQYRSRKVIESPQGIELISNGKAYTNFSSNDYLGLANHPSVKRAFARAAEKYGVGSGASHLVVGHSVEHHALEEELADFTGRQRALLFSTGYMANLGVINALMQKGNAVIEDRLNHASLLDGALLSRATLTRYKHNDADHAGVILDTHHKINPGRAALLAVDGVFSMDGDMAVLPELADLCKQKGAWLMVDDAHGMGCLGERGGGSTAYFSLDQNAVPILVGTLGKAFGTFGAFVAGSDVLIESLIQFARTYVYTTALPPAVAAATRTSLKLVQEENWRREQLNAHVQQFRDGCRKLNLNLLESASPIQAVILGSDARAIRASEVLEKQGFWVSAIRPPTVPLGTSRLRITFSAEHKSAQVGALLEALEQVLELEGSR